ncbi:hypothetical protein CMUS01_05642 [Colletotrichum musicola]|uniref:Uncharacterized protein n=1 Tax=Colletotrichum musicola TaxID=2175873 RepID=A0A8H6NJC2_9PEZI|nr:hypothetical protein CMUS01_05642 [Colletotrichum musicola]
MLNDWNLKKDGKGASYARCSGECQLSDRDGEARAYHVACAERIASSSVRDVIEALAFAYEALLPDLEARKSRLRSLSESCLHRAFPQLPAEICASIAELCLRRMAVAHTWDTFPCRGLKVRRIVSVDEAAADNNGSASILWAALPPRIPRLIQLEKSHPPARMATFVCNGPGVIAYSVHFNLRITSIHAHTSEEDLSMYKSRPASIEHRGLWQYFPLHSGERITEIWVRGSQWLRVALIFKTSHDRVVVFGQHETIKSKTRLSLMDRPCQKKPSRIFFEDSNAGVRAMAFESSRPRVSPEYIVDLPQPTRNLVKSTAPVPWSYSTACLRGIKEVVPSQRCKPG